MEFKWNYRQFEALRDSPEVLDVLVEAADKVADGCNSELRDEQRPYKHFTVKKFKGRRKKQGRSFAVVHENTPYAERANNKYDLMLKHLGDGKL